MTVTIVPIPKAMRRPGSTRVSQSNMSKGTNGSPASFHAKKKIPISDAASMAATNEPLKIPGRRIFIPGSFLFRSRSLAPLASADTYRHVQQLTRHPRRDRRANYRNAI